MTLLTITDTWGTLFVTFCAIAGCLYLLFLLDIMEDRTADKRRRLKRQSIQRELDADRARRRIIEKAKTAQVGQGKYQDNWN